MDPKIFGLTRIATGTVNNIVFLQPRGVFSGPIGHIFGLTRIRQCGILTLFLIRFVHFRVRIPFGLLKFLKGQPERGMLMKIGAGPRCRTYNIVLAPNRQTGLR